MPHPSGRPWVIAHRGASALHTENTVEAFRRAAELGADAVELDVRRTFDDALVIHHDATVPGLGRPIVTMPLSVLRKEAPWVPTLAEALEACDGMWVNVEIKNWPADPDWDPEDLVAHDALALIEEAHWTSRVLISSFNPASAAVAAGRTRVGLLIPSGVDPLGVIAEGAAASYDTLHPHAGSLGPIAAEELVRAAGPREIIVWTVDDPQRVRDLAAAGVGGIITNEPDVALAALEDGNG